MKTLTDNSPLVGRRQFERDWRAALFLEVHWIGGRPASRFWLSVDVTIHSLFFVLIFLF